MWVARDKVSHDNSIKGLYLFMRKDKPRRISIGQVTPKDFWAYIGGPINSDKVFLNDDDFPQFKNLTWEDEPIKVELCQVFNSREYNILNQLEKAYNTADDGSNPFNNDAGGTSFCSDIKNMITPILEKIKKDIDIINK